jgi:hypothetical protein
MDTKQLHVYMMMLNVVYTQARVVEDWRSLILVDNSKLVPYKDATGSPDEIVIQTAADMARALGRSSFSVALAQYFGVHLHAVQ